jgi:hypothetical protein
VPESTTSGDITTGEGAASPVEGAPKPSGGTKPK